MAASPIEGYLDRLDHELRARRAPRRRLLAEAEDHLRSAAEELVAGRRSFADAEQEAIERFGTPPEVAHRFAHAKASSTARAAVGWAAAAFLAYCTAALVFLAAAPDWLRDFPHGAPSTLALQVAAVALALTAIRFRRRRVFDEERLRLIANGALTAALAVAAGAGAELFIALTRPAAAPWADAPAPIGAFALAAVLCTPAVLAAAVSHTRASGLGWHGEAGFTLADDVEAIVPGLGRPVRTALQRPGWTCAVVACSTFVAVTIAQLATSDASLVFGAAAVGLFEATAIVLGFLMLGRPLGLRAPRTTQ
jgi:hypothetical protein